MGTFAVLFMVVLDWDHCLVGILLFAAIWMQWSFRLLAISQ
jgi:hypothetical protein